MTASAKWDDLRARTISAVLMVAVGAAAIWLGGVWFLALVAVVTGLMIWELLRMLMPEARGLAQALGALAAVAVILSTRLPGLAVPVVLALPVLAGAVLVARERVVFMLYAPVIMLTGHALLLLRSGADGLLWLLWLVLVVVVTDIAGYFAGRIFGGPKFWPRISPKKTWSGTVAGWIGAAILGLVFMRIAGAGVALVAVSMLASFASQMGDIAESAIKRRMGVKDSSTLIPGHGGVLDRFDGMLGAALLVLLLMVLSGYQPGAR